MRKLSFTLAFIVVLTNHVISQQWDKHMQVKKMDIRVDANAFTATTFIEMEFYNPTNTDIEGLYSFALEPGQAITAFQLDLNGKYRDGSIEERWKARAAYNTIVGKRVDPALLQMDYINHYSLHIYPVPAKKSRRITMTIEQLLNVKDVTVVYKLPLEIIDTIEQLSINIAVNSCTGSPSVMPGFLANQSFSNDKNSYYRLLWSPASIKADKPLSFSIPVSLEKPLVCIKNTNGSSFFALRIKPSVLRSYTINSKKVTVFWDVSAKGNRRNISKDIDFLKQYISANTISKLEIIPFNQRPQNSVVFNCSDSSWAQYLRLLQYEGAARFDNLDFSHVNTDVILVFSDGRSTVGKSLPGQSTVYVYCISSAVYTDSLYLEKVIGRSGGHYINLAMHSIAESVALAGKAENILLTLEIAGQKVNINQKLSELEQDILLLTGEIVQGSQEQTIVLRYGNNENIHGEERIEISNYCTCNESSIDRIAMLTVYNGYATRYNYWMDVLDFGKQEKVVTQSTSYIVLEKIEDYIKYNILPPKELESQCDMNLFVKADKERRENYKKQDEFESLSEVANAYNERILWWDKKQPLITLTEEKKEEAMAEVKKEKQEDQVKQTTPVAASAISPKGSLVQDFPEGANVITGNEVVVTALGISRQPKEIGYSVSRVRSAELTQAKVVSVPNGLTGKVSGLNVQTVDNGVFADTRITLRGIRSLTGNNQPLVILDGAPIEIRYLSLINPNDVRDVTILKSASATAIYGPDGVNGALLITTKIGSRISYYQTREKYRLKDMDDEDYLVEFRAEPFKSKMDRYKEIKNIYGYNAGFYFDIAQNLFESGYKKGALDVLYTAADNTNGDWQILKAIGYTLESWKEFDEAISLYKLMLSETPNDLQTCRNLALAYYQNGNYQQSVDIFYEGITNMYSNKVLKGMMLQEMNAVIAVHKDVLDISKINQQFIRPLAVDLRVTFECNRSDLSNHISIAEPGGNICSVKKPLSDFGGRLSKKDIANNVSIVSPEEYQIKNAADGKYKFRVGYRPYNSYYYDTRTPTIIKMTIFKNLGKPDQSIKVENVIMDNQYGDVEIGELKW